MVGPEVGVVLVGSLVGVVLVGRFVVVALELSTSPAWPMAARFTRFPTVGFPAVGYLCDKERRNL